MGALCSLEWVVKWQKWGLEIIEAIGSGCRNVFSGHFWIQQKYLCRGMKVERGLFIPEFSHDRKKKWANLLSF